MKLTLKKKAALLIVGIAVLVSFLAIVIVDGGFYRVITKQYEQRAIDIANLTAEEVNADELEILKDAVLDIYNKTDNKVLSDKWGTPEFERYVSKYNSIYDMKEYKDILSELHGMQDVLNVDCLYIVWVDVETETYIYIVDAADEGACPVGCIDPLFTEDEEERKNPYNGMAPNISNSEEYGRLMSTGMPIRNSKGEFVALSTVDISMNEIIELQNHVMIYIGFAFLGVIILICLIGVYLVNRIIVKPINKLSDAASGYTHNSNVFENLNMSRSDEIGTLADSMANMEKDINSYISNLEKTTNDLIEAREHAEEMYIAANIDALTKVRNKRAFDIELERLNNSKEQYGFIMVDMNDLKAVNDTYGHAKGDSSIKTVCKITCSVFKHSPVYRIGGDEFAVILEDTDLKHRAQLIEELKERFKSSACDETVEPWKRVSAAVGCAVYDSEKDENSKKVLSRADAEMYEDKHNLKKRS
ncbi:MAG: diguanylate cyclase [Eubacterium sp.]|nr:diguanylate cyclase [Eubacterium sp.]